MRKYKIKFTPRFNFELQEFFDSIYFDYSDPVDAIRVTDKIKKKCYGLAIFPKSLPGVTWKKKDFYFIHVGKHTIIYTVDDDANEVVVRALVYSGRDIMALLKKGVD